MYYTYNEKGKETNCGRNRTIEEKEIYEWLRIFEADTIKQRR